MRRELGLAAAGVLLTGVAAAAAAALAPAPAGARKLFEFAGDGVQVYACSETAGKFGWQFKGPEANLYDRDGRQTGTHFAGPTWKLQDGSAMLPAVDGTLDPGHRGSPLTPGDRSCGMSSTGLRDRVRVGCGRGLRGPGGA